MSYLVAFQLKKVLKTLAAPVPDEEDPTGEKSIILRGLPPTSVIKFNNFFKQHLVRFDALQVELPLERDRIPSGVRTLRAGAVRRAEGGKRRTSKAKAERAEPTTRAKDSGPRRGGCGAGMRAAAPMARRT